MTRRGDDYSPDERGRYDGDHVWVSPFDCPGYTAQALAECTAKVAAFDAHQASLYGTKTVTSSDDRHCRTCHGKGTLTDAYDYGPASLTTCFSCGGAVTR